MLRYICYYSTLMTAFLQVKKHRNTPRACLRPTSPALRATSPCRGGFGSPRKVNGFARGSPTRGAVERSETERLYEGKPDHRCAAALSCRACPLRLLRRHLSQRERLWQAGPLPTGRRRPDMAQKRGPRLRGQRQLDNAPCQAAVNLGSSALLFPRHRALLVQHRPDRYAKGSPSGRAGA